jgi:colanic acid/amylovoran biosynthesis protein
MRAKKKVLVGPVGTDCNRGDQALLWEAIAAVRRVIADCEIAVMSEDWRNPEDPRTRQTRGLGVKVLPMMVSLPRREAPQEGREFIDSGWQYLVIKAKAVVGFLKMVCLLVSPRSRRLARWVLGKERCQSYDYLRSCDHFVVKGGGFMYAHRGLRWAYFIWFGLYFLMIAQRCGLGVIVLPNSFGPFDTRWGRWLAKRVLSRCKIVAAREPKSLEVLNGLIPGKARLYPDMAFRLEPADSKWAEGELNRHGVPLGQKACVGITMRPWRFPNSRDPRSDYKRYVQGFVCLFEYLREKGYEPVLCAHTTGPSAHENDRIALKDAIDLSSKLSKVLYVDGDYNCRQVKSFYGLMDFMVCTRFHSAIFSIAQGIPCLAISYQGYKAPGIMEEIGLEDYTLSIDAIDDQSLVEAFDRLAANQEPIRKKMRSYMKACRQRLGDLQDLIAAELMSGNEESMRC